MLVRHIKAPNFPQFHFEWHSENRTVYMIRLGPTQPIGEPIAHEVTDHGAAQNAVLIWLRGYRTGQAEKMLVKEDA